MKIFILGLGFLLCAHLSADAQKTWNGLSFGMSSDEVLGAPQLEKLQLKESQGVLRSTNDWLYPSSNSDLAMPFTVAIYFKNQRLDTIELKLDLIQYVSSIQTLSSANSQAANFASKVAFSLALRALGENLVGKYGRPVDVAGACDADVETAVNRKEAKSCNKVWSYEGQRVEYYWSLPAKTVFISYIKTDNGL